MTSAVNAPIGKSNPARSCVRNRTDPQLLHYLEDKSSSIHSTVSKGGQLPLVVGYGYEHYPPGRNEFDLQLLAESKRLGARKHQEDIERQRKECIQELLILTSGKENKENEGGRKRGSGEDHKIIVPHLSGQKTSRGEQGRGKESRNSKGTSAGWEGGEKQKEFKGVLGETGVYGGKDKEVEVEEEEEKYVGKWENEDVQGGRAYTSSGGMKEGKRYPVSTRRRPPPPSSTGRPSFSLQKKPVVLITPAIYDPPIPLNRVTYPVIAGVSIHQEENASPLPLTRHTPSPPCAHNPSFSSKNTTTMSEQRKNDDKNRGEDRNIRDEGSEAGGGGGVSEDVLHPSPKYCITHTLSSSPSGSSLATEVPHPSSSTTFLPTTTLPPPHSTHALQSKGGSGSATFSAGSIGATDSFSRSTNTRIGGAVEEELTVSLRTGRVEVLNSSQDDSFFLLLCQGLTQEHLLSTAGIVSPPRSMVEDTGTRDGHQARSSLVPSVTGAVEGEEAISPMSPRTNVLDSRGRKRRASISATTSASSSPGTPSKASPPGEGGEVATVVPTPVSLFTVSPMSSAVEGVSISKLDHPLQRNPEEAWKNTNNFVTSCALLGLMQANYSNSFSPPHGISTADTAMPRDVPDTSSCSGFPTPHSLISHPSTNGRLNSAPQKRQNNYPMQGQERNRRRSMTGNGKKGANGKSMKNVGSEKGPSRQRRTPEGKIGGDVCISSPSSRRHPPNLVSRPGSAVVLPYPDHHHHRTFTRHSGRNRTSRSASIETTASHDSGPLMRPCPSTSFPAPTLPGTTTFLLSKGPFPLLSPFLCFSPSAPVHSCSAAVPAAGTSPAPSPATKPPTSIPPNEKREERARRGGKGKGGEGRARGRGRGRMQAQLFHLQKTTPANRISAEEGAKMVHPFSNGISRTSIKVQEANPSSSSISRSSSTFCRSSSWPSPHSPLYLKSSAHSSTFFPSRRKKGKNETNCLISDYRNNNNVYSGAVQLTAGAGGSANSSSGGGTALPIRPSVEGANLPHPLARVASRVPHCTFRQSTKHHPHPEHRDSVVDGNNDDGDEDGTSNDPDNAVLRSGKAGVQTAKDHHRKLSHSHPHSSLCSFRCSPPPPSPSSSSSSHSSSTSTFSRVFPSPRKGTPYQNTAASEPSRTQRQRRPSSCHCPEAVGVLLRRQRELKVMAAAAICEAGAVALEEGEGGGSPAGRNSAETERKSPALPSHQRIPPGSPPHISSHYHPCHYTSGTPACPSSLAHSTATAMAHTTTTTSSAGGSLSAPLSSFSLSRMTLDSVVHPLIKGEAFPSMEGVWADSEEEVGLEMEEGGSYALLFPHPPSHEPPPPRGGGGRQAATSLFLSSRPKRHEKGKRALKSYRPFSRTRNTRSSSSTPSSSSWISSVGTTLPESLVVMNDYPYDVPAKIWSVHQKHSSSPPPSSFSFQRKSANRRLISVLSASSGTPPVPSSAHLNIPSNPHYDRHHNTSICISSHMSNINNFSVGPEEERKSSPASLTHNADLLLACSSSFSTSQRENMGKKGEQYRNSHEVHSRSSVLSGEQYSQEEEHELEQQQQQPLQCSVSSPSVYCLNYTMARKMHAVVQLNEYFAKEGSASSQNVPVVSSSSISPSSAITNFSGKESEEKKEEWGEKRGEAYSAASPALNLPVKRSTREGRRPPLPQKYHLAGARSGSTTQEVSSSPAPNLSHSATSDCISSSLFRTSSQDNKGERGEKMEDGREKNTTGGPSPPPPSFFTSASSSSFPSSPLLEAAYASMQSPLPYTEDNTYRRDLEGVVNPHLSPSLSFPISLPDHLNRACSSSGTSTTGSEIPSSNGRALHNVGGGNANSRVALPPRTADAGVSIPIYNAALPGRVSVGSSQKINNGNNRSITPSSQRNSSGSKEGLSTSISSSHPSFVSPSTGSVGLSSFSRPDSTTPSLPTNASPTFHSGNIREAVHSSPQVILEEKRRQRDNENVGKRNSQECKEVRTGLTCVVMEPCILLVDLCTSLCVVEATTPCGCASASACMAPPLSWVLSAQLCGVAYPSGLASFAAFQYSFQRRAQRYPLPPPLLGSEGPPSASSAALIPNSIAGAAPSIAVVEKEKEENRQNNASIQTLVKEGSSCPVPSTSSSTTTSAATTPVTSPCSAWGLTLPFACRLSSGPYYSSFPVSLPIRILLVSSPPSPSSFSLLLQTAEEEDGSAPTLPCAVLFLCTIDTVSTVFTSFLPSLRSRRRSSCTEFGGLQDPSVDSNSSVYRDDEFPWVGIILVLPPLSYSSPSASCKEETMGEKESDYANIRPTRLQHIRQCCADQQVVLFSWEGDWNTSSVRGEKSTGNSASSPIVAYTTLYDPRSLLHAIPSMNPLFSCVPGEKKKLSLPHQNGSNEFPLVNVSTFSSLPPLLWEHLHQIPWHFVLQQRRTLRRRTCSPSTAGREEERRRCRSHEMKIKEEQGRKLSNPSLLESKMLYTSSELLQEIKELKEEGTAAENPKKVEKKEGNTKGISNGRGKKEYGHAVPPSRPPLLLVITEDEDSGSSLFSQPALLEESSRNTISTPSFSMCAWDSEMVRTLQFLFTYPPPSLSPSSESKEEKLLFGEKKRKRRKDIGSDEDADNKRFHSSACTSPVTLPKYATCCALSLNLSSLGEEEREKESGNSDTAVSLSPSFPPPFAALSLKLFNPYLFPSSPSAERTKTAYRVFTQFTAHPSGNNNLSKPWWISSQQQQDEEEEEMEEVAEVQVLCTAISWLPVLLDADVPASVIAPPPPLPPATFSPVPSHEDSPRGTRTSGSLVQHTNNNNGENTTPGLHRTQKVKDIVAGVITIIGRKEDHSRFPGETTTCLPSPMAMPTASRPPSASAFSVPDLLSRVVSLLSLSQPSPLFASSFSSPLHSAGLTSKSHSHASRKVPHLCVVLPCERRENNVTTKKDHSEEKGMGSKLYHRKEQTNLHHSRPPLSSTSLGKASQQSKENTWWEVEKVYLPPSCVAPSSLPAASSLGNAGNTHSSTPSSLLWRSEGCSRPTDSRQDEKNKVSLMRMEKEEEEDEEDGDRWDTEGTVGLARLHEWLHCWWLESRLDSSPPPPPCRSTSTSSRCSTAADDAYLAPCSHRVCDYVEEKREEDPHEGIREMYGESHPSSFSSPIPRSSSMQEKDVEANNSNNDNREQETKKIESIARHSLSRGEASGCNDVALCFFVDATEEVQREWAKHVFSDAFYDARLLNHSWMTQEEKEIKNNQNQQKCPGRDSKVRNKVTLCSCSERQSREASWWSWSTNNRYFSAEVFLKVLYPSLSLQPSSLISLFSTSSPTFCSSCSSCSASPSPQEWRCSLEKDDGHDHNNCKSSRTEMKKVEEGGGRGPNEENNDTHPSPLSLVVITSMLYLNQAVSFLKMDKMRKSASAGVPRVGRKCEEEATEEKGKENGHQHTDKIVSSCFSSFLWAMQALLLPFKGSVAARVSSSSKIFSQSNNVEMMALREEKEKPSSLLPSSLPPLNENEEEVVGASENALGCGVQGGEEEPLRILYIVDVSRSNEVEAEAESYLDQLFTFLLSSASSSVSSSCLDCTGSVEEGFPVIEIIFADPPSPSPSISTFTPSMMKTMNSICCSNPDGHELAANTTSLLAFHDDVAPYKEKDGCARLREAFQQHVWPIHRWKEEEREAFHVSQEEGEEEEKAGEEEEDFHASMLTPASRMIPQGIGVDDGSRRGISSSDLPQNPLVRAGGETPAPLRCTCALPPHFMVHPITLKSLPLRVLEVLQEHSSLRNIQEELRKEEVVDTPKVPQEYKKAVKHAMDDEEKELTMARKSEDTQKGDRAEERMVEKAKHPSSVLSPEEYRRLENELMSWMQDIKQRGDVLPLSVRRDQAGCLTMAFEELLKLSPQ